MITLSQRKISKTRQSGLTSFVIMNNLETKIVESTPVDRLYDVKYQLLDMYSLCTIVWKVWYIYFSLELES